MEKDGKMQLWGKWKEEKVVSAKKYKNKNMLAISDFMITFMHSFIVIQRIF